MVKRKINQSVIYLLITTLFFVNCQFVSEILPSPELDPIPSEILPLPELDPIPGEVMLAIAADLYDAVDDPETDTRDVIRDIVTVLGFYQDPNTKEDVVMRIIEGGEPVMLEDHIIAMAKGFDNRMFVTLESFIKTLNEKALRSGNLTGTLTIEHLNQGFEPLIAQNKFEMEEVIPALILFLGLERVSRTGEIIDPVWADKTLDPLQFTLFSYLLSFQEVETDPSSHSGLVDFQRMGLYDATNYSQANIFTSGMVNILWTNHSPVNPKMGATADWKKALQDFPRGRCPRKIANWITKVGLKGFLTVRDVICASVLLYSHDVSLKISEENIYRRWPENPTGRPYKSEFTGKVVFDFYPHNRASELIISSSCFPTKIPENGSVPDKSVEWLLSEELPLHGEVESKQEYTDSTGIAKATFTAFDEVVPLELRHGLPEVATGVVYFKVKHLLPIDLFLYEILIREIGYLHTPGRNLNVHYYEFPELDVSFKAEFVHQGYYVTKEFGVEVERWPLHVNGNFQANFPLHFNEEEKTYIGSGTLSYVSANISCQAAHVNCDTGALSDGELELKIDFSNIISDPQISLTTITSPAERFRMIYHHPDGSVTDDAFFPLFYEVFDVGIYKSLTWVYILYDNPGYEPINVFSHFSAPIISVNQDGFVHLMSISRQNEYDIIKIEIKLSQK